MNKTYICKEGWANKLREVVCFRDAPHLKLCLNTLSIGNSKMFSPEPGNSISNVLSFKAHKKVMKEFEKRTRP